MEDRSFPDIHGQESLHAYIVRHLDADRHLADPLATLPDEEPPDPTTASFMAGAKDGTLGKYFSSGGDTDRAAELADQLIHTAKKPNERRLKKLYEALSDDTVLDYIDPMIEQLADKRPPAMEIADIGGWLASASPDRGPVKVGIALLGITGAPNGELIHELGAHEEFTLYASVAFANAREDPEPDLYRLAKAVSGWGRIHCVERLASTQNPEIRDWILLDGFRNVVMNEYLAYTAATVGDLARRLEVAEPSRELLTAAADIIKALIMGAPGKDIDDYEDAPLAVDHFLRHMHNRAETLADLIAVDHCRRFLKPSDEWNDRLARLWSETRRADLYALCESIIAHERWPALTARELESDDRMTFWRADRAARVLGIDTFDRHITLISNDPLDGTWFQAWRLADNERAEQLVALAREHLGLESIASGPSTAIGLGPDFQPHQALGWTLQALRDYPGLGGDLLTAALWSPSIQNRNGALKALKSWGPSHWTDEHKRLLNQLATDEPMEKTRQVAQDLLNSM